MAIKPLLTINIHALFNRISNNFNQSGMVTLGCMSGLMARMKSLMEALPIGESIAFDTTCRRQEQSLANHFRH